VKSYKFKFELEGEIMASETIQVTITVNPAQPGAFTVKDANGNVIQDGDSITLNPETVGVNDPGQVIAVVSGGTAPYSVALASGSLPEGMDISSVENEDDSETFSLEGTPTLAGTGVFDLTFSDSANTSVTLKGKKITKSKG
jgi:hypothetical protein